ncbi:MAG: hypothetical protein ABH852_03020 [Methanobacteriota archaeon]
MLITTSRRPGQLARILCRGLVRVIPGSRYVPRGTKTVGKVGSVSRELGHDRVIFVNSVSGKPKEIRFIEVGRDWRWVDAMVELGEVKIQREASRSSKLEDLRIHADGPRAQEFAEFVGKLLGISLSDKLPESGGVALITTDNGLKVQFRAMPSSKAIGPVLQVTAFGSLFKGGVGKMEADEHG